ncbi:Methyltransferase domain-containing protein [Proteiniborus ethanoligenes]|uniref:Methyltransferase domain-containing protein n=1 Tax=Proteiniborus ethanoligenes TaxID=415015 RepID=A0A1H3KN00_9FIRM|nr:class I SAM-dependent methyltransferase [Proteiniborus ethanoligenes]SDY53410.1 Methyltransferase domain-containing protein [Proteiniborus ethanoligenes]
MNQDERMFSIGVQNINLKEFSQKGRVLDIGGGGEGIIGQLLGEKVIAIDPRSDELEEAAEGPLKIIMDARELKFLNKTFDGVTSFFTLMYIEKQYHQKVFEEIYRVLKDEGEFVIWDATISQFPGGIKDIILVPLEIELKDKKITTTYGVLWNKAQQDMKYYIKLGEKIGFEVITKEEMNQTYYIRFKKKVSI